MLRALLTLQVKSRHAIAVLSALQSSLCVTTGGKGGLNPAQNRDSRRLIGYVCAFVTGSSFMVTHERITPAGSLADLALDREREKHLEAHDPTATHCQSLVLSQHLAPFPVGISLGCAAHLSTSMLSSVGPSSPSRVSACAARTLNTHRSSPGHAIAAV